MQEHAFQAQVSEVLSLVINSLYSNKEIFLRELLSNASDALDKERFLSSTETGSGGEPLRIRVIPDEKAGTLTIDDNGIGMDEAELIKNLGTIAHSGSREFLSQLSEKKDVNLIGQFGVGFYSAYLVADRVEVISKKRGSDSAHRWISDGKRSFSTEPAERAERGTALVLHLKEDQKEYLSTSRIRTLVQRYSDYVGYPIELGSEKDGAVTFERINQASALWQRRPADVSDEQYEEFYKHLTHDWEPPLARKHFRVEGTQEFTGLLFVPKRPPFDLFSSEDQHGVRLHVKRVFIMDDCKELLPRWLRFVRGVVDSEDLPLNVSRELLQDSKLVRIIRKQVVKHVLDLLDEVAEKRPEDYALLWKTYGTVLKEGLHFEPEHKDRLAKLVRFESSKADAPTSLADYVKRMPAEQKAIFYIYGPSRRTLEASPHLESLKARGYEVLYMTDPVDEFAVRGLGEFEGKSLVSATDEKLELGAAEGEDKDKKSEQTAEQTAELKPLLERFQEVLKEQVSEVRVSERLTDSPSCLVVPEGGLGPYIERLLRMQQGGGDMPSTKRILELNPTHALVRSLAQLSARHEDDSELAEYIELVYDQALLSEGSPIDDPARVGKRLARLLATSVAARAAT